MSENIIDELKSLKDRIAKLEKWIKNYEYKQIMLKKEEQERVFKK
jgi:anion-transporting  ArsA/GET3 family ATPase